MVENCGLTPSLDPARLGLRISGGEAVATAVIGEGADEGVITGENEEKGTVSDLACAAGGGEALVGVGKLAVFAMAGGATRGVGAGLKGGAESGDCVPAKVAPLSRLTRLGVTDLPEKNSPAEREASTDGAGGKMSDWKLSAWELILSVRPGISDTEPEDNYFSGYDEGDRFNSRSNNFVSTSDLAVGKAQRATRKEAHATLWIRGFVLRQCMEGIIFEFVITDISVAVGEYESQR